MLGYNLNDSSKELYEEYQRKLQYANDKDEVDFGYMIISDPQFLQSFKGKYQEGWKYLKNSMEIPPTLLIDNFIGKSNCHICIEPPSYKLREKKKIHCYLCPEQLSRSMNEKIKFLKIKCSCNTMYTHIKCGNDFIIKNGMCDVCKQYYDVNQYCSSLASTLKPCL